MFRACSTVCSCSPHALAGSYGPEFTWVIKKFFKFICYIVVFCLACHDVFWLYLVVLLFQHQLQMRERVVYQIAISGTHYVYALCICFVLLSYTQTSDRLNCVFVATLDLVVFVCSAY